MAAVSARWRQWQLFQWEEGLSAAEAMVADISAHSVTEGLSEAEAMVAAISLSQHAEGLSEAHKIFENILPFSNIQQNGV